jgi:peptidyl-prolyl cis-trans isomerase SurA
VGELDMRVNWLMDQIGSKEKLEEYYNKTMTQIREMIRENIRNEQTVRKMKGEIVGDVKIVPADVRRYFNSLPADSIPFIPTQVEVQIITQQPKIPQAEIERVKKTLRDFTERIEKGEISFGALARLYSVDKVTARRGGESGDFQSKGMLVPEFANVVFNLTDPKKVSKVIETEYGYHIAQLIERRGDRINYRHILLRPEVEERELDASLNRLDSLAKDIRNGKFTFDEAAMYVSHDKDTRNNHGLMANPETRTARFEMQELAQVSQEIAKTVNEMNVGEVSEPFVMINRQGKEVCAIVKLKARIDGHKATIAEDYQRLKAVVQEKLGEEKLMKWIAQKQKTTYVRINDDWKKCDFKYPGWNIQ